MENKRTEINPDRIKRARIVVGIPSYNEADTIAKVVRKVDEGLAKNYPNYSAVIINSDNNSPDETGRVFLNTKTRTPKIYLSTPPGVKGKGNNLRNFLQAACSLKAESCLLVDSDLKNIKAGWIKCLAGSIFKGYDYTVPVYYRDKNDGSITNHICFPLIYGLLGYNIRQPISGEVAFSRKVAQHLLKQEWTEEIKRFGIDIFMSFNAVKGGFKLCRVNLGAKIHNASAPKLDDMFLEVVGTFFKLLSENENLWHREVSFHGLPLVYRSEDRKKYPEIEINPREFERKALAEFPLYYPKIKKHISSEIRQLLERMFFQEKSLDIDSSFWSQLVYEMFYIYCNNSNRTETIKLLRALYFGRIAMFNKKVAGLNRREVEHVIQRQAQKFYRRRRYLLSLLKK